MPPGGVDKNKTAQQKRNAARAKAVARKPAQPNRKLRDAPKPKPKPAPQPKPQAQPRPQAAAPIGPRPRPEVEREKENRPRPQPPLQRFIGPLTQEQARGMAYVAPASEPLRRWRQAEDSPYAQQIRERERALQGLRNWKPAEPDVLRGRDLLTNTYDAPLEILRPPAADIARFRLRDHARPLGVVGFLALLPLVE